MTSAPARVFWRYWTGTTVSGVGDAISAVALPLTAVLVLHASALQVGLVTAAGYAAWAVFGLPAGALVARLPLRGTQIAMDLIRAAALASIPLSAWAGVLNIGQLAAVAFTVSVANVVFGVGNSTFMPQIVAPEELTKRNSLTSASDSATNMAGPSLAGVLVQAFGAATTVLFDVASYLASALLLRSLPRPARLPAAATSSIRAQIGEGWQYVTRHPVLRPCVAAATATNFVCGALLALTPVFLVRTLHTPASLVGVLIATEGAGSLAGAALTPRIGARTGSARALLFASAAMPLALCMLPASFQGPGLLLFAFGNAGFAAAVVVLSILTRTHRHRVVPTELLPRVMATVRFISWGVIPLGALAAGAAATAFGPRAALWVTCAAATVPAIALWTSRTRNLRELTDEITTGPEPAPVSALGLRSGAIQVIAVTCGHPPRSSHGAGPAPASTRPSAPLTVGRRAQRAAPQNRRICVQSHHRHEVARAAHSGGSGSSGRGALDHGTLAAAAWLGQTLPADSGPPKDRAGPIVLGLAERPVRRGLQSHCRCGRYLQLDAAAWQTSWVGERIDPLMSS